MVKRKHIVAFLCFFLFVQCNNQAALSDDMEALKQQLAAANTASQSGREGLERELANLQQQLAAANTASQSGREGLERELANLQRQQDQQDQLEADLEKSDAPFKLSIARCLEFISLLPQEEKAYENAFPDGSIREQVLLKIEECRECVSLLKPAPMAEIQIVTNENASESFSH